MYMGHDRCCLELLSAEKRQAEAQRIRDKYPDRIPVRRPRYVMFFARSSLTDAWYNVGYCGEG